MQILANLLLMVAAIESAQSAASPEGRAAGRKANVKGPTVEEIHAVAIAFGGVRPPKYGGTSVGPIIWPGGRVEFEYTFPDGTKVAFWRCGVEHRCDFARFSKIIAKGDATEAAAAQRAMSTCSDVDRAVSPPIDATKSPDVQGEIVAVQQWSLGDTWTAGLLHEEIYPSFVACTNKAREGLGIR